MSDNLTVTYDESALVSRLSTALKRRSQQVICIVGSPLTSPISPGTPGVPGVDGVLQMIREEFVESDDELRRFELELNSSQGRHYQTAFRFLQGSRGQSVSNEIVRRAVLQARRNFDPTVRSRMSDAECRLFESDQENWHLNPGIIALGQLIAEQPEIFGSAVLTTNFDPLLEVAMRRASANFYKTVLSADGSLTQTEADGCHVIHLHGYWFGSDTLHTNRQLAQERPRSRNSLANLLRDKVVLVCGYGGWDDVLTSTLLNLVRDDSSSLEVLWALHGATRPSSPVLNEFRAAGKNRGRVSFYSGIDCNTLFPRVLQAWAPFAKVQHDVVAEPLNPVHISPELEKALDHAAGASRVLEGDDEDRPPVFDFCIGRDREISALDESKERVIFITGIGGQGKSTLAAKYFAIAQNQKRFSYFVWRDCKEEGERFENQIAAVIETLSGGIIGGSELAKRPLESLIEMLLLRLTEVSGLFVFDNVDHLVNLVNGRLTSSADLFVKRFLGIKTQCQVVFTCRPEVWHQGTLSLRLEGLTMVAATELFAARNGRASAEEIAEAHRLTDGHAFWMDLLALQLVRNQDVRLSTLVAEIRAGQGTLPDVTLQSIWSKLPERETLVLRAMAETLRPETEQEIASYLSNEFTYNRVNRALRALRQLNLIVVKRSAQGEDLHELHPLVRQFVRARSSGRQRTTMIDAIIKVYNRFRGAHRNELSGRPTFSLLQNWTQAAELATEAGRFSEAFECLSEVRHSYDTSAFTREFTRVLRHLLSACDWTRDHPNLRDFDVIFRTHTRNLAHLGLYDEVEDLLDKFSLTIPEPDSRYILYCEMRSHVAWIREDFQQAITWGKVGQEIQEKSGVDTSSDVDHTLALAWRDAGSPEKALPFFLKTKSLDDALDPDDLDENLGGPYYGNIGRCLHFMGQSRNALVCYQKSALLLEKEVGFDFVRNQGYIRLWIGELLLSRDQRELGVVFLDAARRKWEEISPVRARRLEEMLRQIFAPDILEKQGQRQDRAESICRDWIRGRNLDSLFD